MIKSVSEIKKGDIILYRSGRINHVNKPFKYELWFDEDFKHIEYNRSSDIMEIKRFVKILGLYRLKTIYKRKGK